MKESSPPPLPKAASIAGKRGIGAVTGAIIGIAICVGFIVVAAVGLRFFGLLIPYTVPTAAMAPAIEPGDSVFMEGITYLRRKPARGDILVFRHEDLPDSRGVKRNEVFVKRLVGLPGDELRLKQGILYVNGQATSLHNKAGEIHYVQTPHFEYLKNDAQTVKVPDGSYFVLGDFSAHSADSRIWGFVAKDTVMGRAAFCYWPLKHVGPIR
jgi:signal peptidase I